MNKKVCIMVRCIVEKDKKNSKELKELLEQKIKKQWPDTAVELRQDAPYWKYEDSSDLVYAILAEKIIAVKELISLFDVTWIYSCNPTFNVNTQMSEELEEGLWSKNVHAREEFLLDWATWVHIYTWSE